MPTEFSHNTRRENLQRFDKEPFDLLIIGGGITGAGIARDAALRGMSVALVERSDFASGTSSKSSKLIHGGFRYLETYDFRLVYESCCERYLLSKLIPRLVEPIPFLFPFYDLPPFGMLYRSAGMWCYDMLAMFRNVQRHRMLNPRRAMEAEPGIRPEGLNGAALYYDCQTNDAWLTMATLQDAHRRGAAVTNYTEAKSLKLAERESECVVKDALTDAEVTVRAKVVVNASGPWMDKVREMSGMPQPRLQTSKGTHLVIARDRVKHERSVLFQSPDDGRVLLIIPAGNVSIIGTTEVNDDVEQTFSDIEEVDYLISGINHAFPDTHLSADDVWCSYAGHRPLIRSTRGNLTAASRKHEIFQDDDGLISIGGGKLTTHRAMAEETVDIVARRLGKHSPCKTAETPLEESGSPSVASTAEDGHQGSAALRKHLATRYGPAAVQVATLMADAPELSDEIVSDLPYVFAEVNYCMQHEMTMSINDFLCRRVPLLLEDRLHGLSALDRLADLMQSELGWAESEKESQKQNYRAVVKKSEPHRETP